LLAVARAVCTADATGAGHRIVAELVASEATIGGGSQAGQCRPSLAIALRDSRGSSAALANALRGASPPWIARIRHDAVLLDLRSLCCGSDDATLRSAFTQLCLRLA
jgi:seryl-tRNA(Sec) selenium transferase